MCHSPAYVQTVKATASMKPRDLHRQGDQYNSIYICTSSYECARLAAGSAFNAVQAVLEGEVQNAVAIVRPPGHHAESDTGLWLLLLQFGSPGSSFRSAPGGTAHEW
ncbi:unnamed protein product [Lepidochelys kempii]